MAKTPMFDPGSDEARSSWLAGLTEACHKMSGVLGMATGTFENLPLPELFISKDDRYRIYQAPLGTKLWLSAVIKKNGAEITEETDGFTIDYLGGSVAFDPDRRLTADDSLTASGTYITGSSDELKAILQKLDVLSKDAGRYKGYYDTLSALTGAYPTGASGDYAIVGDTFYIWDEVSKQWVNLLRKNIMITAALPVTGWSDGKQTIRHDALLASDDYAYLVAGDADCFFDYSDAGITADNITVDGEITFKYASIPTIDLTANILRLEAE